MIAKTDYLDLFDSLSDAIDFENQALSIGDEYLPEIARKVRDDEAPATPKYWAWLASQVEDRMRQNITAAKRHALPNKDFAVPENEGLPIDTAGRTRAAMARFNQYVFDSKAQAKRAYKRILARAKKFGIDASNFAEEFKVIKGKKKRNPTDTDYLAARETLEAAQRTSDDAWTAYQQDVRAGGHTGAGRFWDAYQAAKRAEEAAKKVYDPLRRQHLQSRRNPMTGPAIGPVGRGHVHHFKANPGAYRVRIRKHGRPDRTAIAEYATDREWYYLSGKPVEKAGWYVDEIIEARRNSSFDASAEFQDGVAKALWADLYMTEVDNLREEGYEDLADELSPGAGGDWMDVLPPVPQAAINDARAFEGAVIDANGVDINTIIVWAQEADGVEYIDEEEFGYYLAMPALGHGVSWFDDHGDFDIKLPHWEAGVYVQNAMADYIADQKEEWDEG